MAQVNLNVTELKGFVNHIIKNNRYLQENNKSPVSIEVVGESGIDILQITVLRIPYGFLVVYLK